MMSSNKITAVLIVSACFSSNLFFAQTKEERKVKTEGVSIDMYNSTQNKEALAFYTEASEKHKKQDYKGAIKLYEKAVDKDPKFVEAYDDMALSYRKLGDLKNAIKYYEKSIELYPNGNMAHMNLGVVYGIQKEYEKAIKQYEIVQKINPDDPEGYYGTVNIYLQLGEFKNAIKNATKTLEIYEATKNPYLSEAQYLLGASYYYDGDKKNAKTYLELAKKNGMQIDSKMANDLGIK